VNKGPRWGRWFLRTYEFIVCRFTAYVRQRTYSRSYKILTKFLAFNVNSNIPRVNPISLNKVLIPNEASHNVGWEAINNKTVFEKHCDDHFLVPFSFLIELFGFLMQEEFQRFIWFVDDVYKAELLLCKWYVRKSYKKSQNLVRNEYTIKECFQRSRYSLLTIWRMLWLHNWWW
jgi:predicted ATPase